MVSAAALAGTDSLARTLAAGRSPNRELLAARATRLPADVPRTGVATSYLLFVSEGRQTHQR